MTSDGAFDEAQARDALNAADRAGESGRHAGRRWARRYLLGFGVVSAGSVLATWLLSPWLSQEWWGLWYAAMAITLIVWLRRQPVRAVPRVLLFALIIVWSIVFGTTMAFAIEYPVAYPIGAIAGFGVWAAGAWWAGR
jgi:hypothetical protein